MRLHATRAPLLRAAMLLGIVVALAGSGRGAVQAQETPAGTITGQVVMGTAGAALEAGVNVELIMLTGTEVEGLRQPLDAEGAYVFEVPANPETRYIPSVDYQGVQYFGAPAALSPEAPAVTVEAITVYEATSDAPALAIRETVMTAVALDRQSGQIGFIREDLVVNPSDHAYIGGTDGVTLRVPAPEGTLEATGENVDGTFALQDGILTTTTPIRALDETAVLSRYLVEYDVVEDRYELRVTVPVATDRIILRIPDEYARALRPQGEARAGEPETLESTSGESVPLDVIVLEEARPGDSLVVTLAGLGLQVNHNPLADRPGNIIASAVALAVLALAGGLAVARSRRAPGEGTP